MKFTPLITCLACLLTLVGCINVNTQSSIDPIHITLDVNLKVQLEEELESVFGDIDAASTTVAASDAPTTINSNL